MCCKTIPQHTCIWSVCIYAADEAYATKHPVAINDCLLRDCTFQLTHDLTTLKLKMYCLYCVVLYHGTNGTYVYKYDVILKMADNYQSQQKTSSFA